MFLLRLPLLLVVIVVVFLWSFNVYRRRVLGVWSNFQPLLTALMVLLCAVCLPSAWEFACGVYRGQPAPEHYLGALGSLYLIGLVLALQVLFLAQFLKSVL